MAVCGPPRWNTRNRPAAGSGSGRDRSARDRLRRGDSVKSSGLRIVENFLDMAHKFVHTDILGAEPHTVTQYTPDPPRRRRVWATNCQCFQPQAAFSATGRIDPIYVPRSQSVRDHPVQDLPECRQPLGRDLPVRAAALSRTCRAHPIMFLIERHVGTDGSRSFPATDIPAGPHHSRKRRPRLLPPSLAPGLDARARPPVAYRRLAPRKKASPTALRSERNDLSKPTSSATS